MPCGWIVMPAPSVTVAGTTGVLHAHESPDPPAVALTAAPGDAQPQVSDVERLAAVGTPEPLAAPAHAQVSLVVRVYVAPPAVNDPLALSDHAQVSDGVRVRPSVYPAPPAVFKTREAPSLHAHESVVYGGTAIHLKYVWAVVSGTELVPCNPRTVAMCCDPPTVTVT
jgi:hypothetical protein